MAGSTTSYWYRSLVRTCWTTYGVKMKPTFKKAERSQVKLKLGIQGPAGSGKTDGALALATSLFPDERLAVIDTENKSASLYSDRYSFDTLEIDPPYESRKYAEGIDAAVDGGYGVLVVDSLSHQWAGDGGILSRKEDLDKLKPSANTYTNWAVFTKEHEKFKAKLLNAPIHIISTLRSKQDYILETNDKGKQVPRKVGMAPIQREGMEYELTLLFDLQMDHTARAIKDRTSLFDERTVNLRDKKVAKELREWLLSGKAAIPPSPEQVKQIMVLGRAAGIDEVRLENRVKTLTLETAAAAIVVMLDRAEKTELAKVTANTEVPSE